jgi:hypothetical protein
MCITTVVKIEVTAKNLKPVKDFEEEGIINFMGDNPRYYREHEFAVVGCIFLGKVTSYACVCTTKR